MQNVKIAYALSFLWRSWFWLGCWIFYYLRFTDYAGIGFLEAIMITTATLGEIPTGAVADILGKRRAVMLAFLLGMVGNVVMAVAPNYWILVASIVTMTVGGAFYSGSLEALVYDSLREKQQEGRYQRVLGRMTSMQNLGMAVAGIIGGFAYTIHPSLPFTMVAIAYFVGFVLSFRLYEPRVDSTQYSWRAFVEQNRQGFGQLFASKQLGYAIILLLIPGMFMLATENVLNDATAVELGFNSVQLGIFATVMYLLGIVVSEKTDWLFKIARARYLYVAMIMLYFVSLIIIPWLGFMAGALLLLLRYGVQTFYSNYESVRINAVTESRYRATTLSTYSLLRNIPYVLAATGIGAAMSVYTAKTFNLYFGLLFGLMLGIAYLFKSVFVNNDRS